MGKYTISHNGGTWPCLGHTGRGVPIWPIEEYLARTEHTPEEVEEIKRLNPNGKPEGELPVGVTSVPHKRCTE